MFTVRVEAPSLVKPVARSLLLLLLARSTATARNVPYNNPPPTSSYLPSFSSLTFSDDFF
jgi:hypothetical protein